MDPIKSIAVPIKRRDPSPKRKRRQLQDGAAQSGEAATEFKRQSPAAEAKPSHRYHVGERLAMARGSREITRAAASCQVLSLVPHEGGPLLYRVRSDAESFERIVDEIDLAPLK